MKAVTKAARRASRVFDELPLSLSNLRTMPVRSTTGTIRKFSLFTTIARRAVNVSASHVTKSAGREPPMNGLNRYRHISKLVTTSMLEIGSAYVLPPWTAKIGVTEKISPPATAEIPPGSRSFPTRKIETTANNDAATLIALAVVGVYPKIFATVAIMNGYPMKCPEEGSEFLQDFQFPTAQTVVRKGDVVGSACGVLEAR
jgi:hypothetical protein